MIIDRKAELTIEKTLEITVIDDYARYYIGWYYTVIMIMITAYENLPCDLIKRPIRDYD